MTRLARRTHRQELAYRALADRINVRRIGGAGFGWCEPKTIALALGLPIGGVIATLDQLVDRGEAERQRPEDLAAVYVYRALA